ncbi:hypothetical protein SPRG_06666 [Saprolegnia parasitica CBS 223.65]|uniref:RING-type domain-containing protein n=1 Tax=Saprolegnia parasitica (strain CBS 223.65) TaxID=695850 RepID=A0A067CD46_SAPPC|nr:hypothetical protein SPRG_06666 [Saprolegnia parasitica CBS 223.65]KDO28428.1 hypothetical protein SPRG_06666 [Saprolegnia parasitica CBS 223.65]|eukprot:XP_012200868.1 hypothetical protein SPRG_06666 [Saprolegnia parasitica CBS 223.65]
MADDGKDEAVAPPRPRMKPILLYEELVLGGVTTTGVKYTCVDVCARFLACGASNGSVYVFARSQKKQATSNVQFRLLKMIAPPSSASERHPVASLSFCPSQRYLVVGTAKGAVYAISLVDPARIGEKIEFSHALHVGFSVNAFLWDADGSRVFSACAGGTVAQTSIRAGMSVLFGNTTTEFLLKEDTAIVQLDVVKTASPARDYLLVSSQTRVLILNLAATDANGVVQVGSKLRQGNYGACFYLDDDEKDYRVFSTRPGRRVWVGDPSTGTVSSTLKFSLTKPPETFFQGPNLPPHEPISVKSLNLSKVHVFKYIHESMDFTPEAPQLLSWFPGTSALFFIDPVGLELVEWHVDLGEIHDLKVLDASVFAVLHGDPGRVAIVRACAAVEFLELAVSNDVAKSIDLVVKYSIQDLALLLNLQCKWTEHIKQHPDDASLVPNATLQALEGLIEIAATLLEEQTKYTLVRSDDRAHGYMGRAPEADVQPPHIVFKQRREMPAISSPKAGASIETELRFALPSAAATSYGQLNLAPSLVVAETGASRSRVVEIPDLSAQDKVVDEAWRAAHLPAPSEAINYKPPTLFGETLDVLDFESHLTNATSSLVSLLPDMSFLRRDSTSDFIDEESFPPLDVPAHVAPSVAADPSLALRIVMAVETTTSDEDAALIVPEAVQLTEPSACIDLESDAEVVLEAISIDLWASQLQVQAALPWLKELEATPLPEPPTSGSSSGDDATTLPLIESPQKLMARARSLSETKRSLIQRTVKRQMGVYPAAHVDWKWHVGGAMQQSPEIAPILARPLPDVEAEFAARVADADQHQKLMLWPTVHLTRSAACLVNHLVHQGDLARATQLLRQWLGTFDPSLDAAVIEKRKAIELIKRSKMAAPAPIEEELPLTRHDWRLVRSLVSLYFLLHADVPLSIEPANTPFVLDNRTRMDDFGISLLVSVPLTPSPSPKLQPFLTKYGNYVHLEMAAQVCSALEHAAGLETVLNLAIASESLAQACDDLLMAVAEKQVLDLSQYTSLCVCLHVLNVLLKKAPAAAIAWCVERYPCVTPWNVQTALFGSQFELTRDAPGNDTYFAYLSALLSTLARAFFNQSHADDADVALLLTILGAPDTFAFDRASAWDLCMQHDMWDGVFQLVLNAIAQPSSRRAGTSELRTLVYTMLQSDTPSRLAMLAGLFERIAVLPNPTPLLHCVLEEMEAFCQLTQKDVAFVPLLHAMLDACGVTLGMELLAAYPTLIAIAPLELYQAVVAAQSLHQRQLQEVGRMLEGIDTYVWSCSRRHHLAFPPQVEALFRIESGFYDTWDTDMPDYTPYSAKDDAAGTKLLHRSYESRNSDWGGDIQLHDSQCAVCDLPLVYLQEDGKTMETILLSCGHAYHDWCLPDRTCPLCLGAHFRFHSIDA